jgi:hypothetical protein
MLLMVISVSVVSLQICLMFSGLSLLAFLVLIVGFFWG